MSQIGQVWDQLFPVEQQRIARLLIDRVQLQPQGLDIVWREDGWQGLREGFDATITQHPLIKETPLVHEDENAWAGELM